MRATLGVRYIDGVTGVAGIATARTEHIDGSVRVQLERIERDGKPGQHWFAENRLVQTEGDQANGKKVTVGEYL